MVLTENTTGRLLGKFRGTVTDNRDEARLGRVRAAVPSVSTEPLTWAAPCFPLAGHQVGMIAVPPVGSTVFLEFIDGCIDHPVWVGSAFSETGQIPDRATTPDGSSTSILLTADGVGLEIVGGRSITLFCGKGPTITLSADGIAIDAGSGTVTVNGRSVDINNGGLRVQ